MCDPAAGTASFLIASMNRMFHDAYYRYGDNPAALAAKLEDIRKNRLYGVELQDKLFAIGTTNMILRGDGKANFQRHNFFDLDIHELRGDILDERTGTWINGHGFTKVLINPPYSQAKTKETRHLSELSFISRALDLLDVRGRLAAIVPQSAMVGKTKEDRDLKEKIMRHHTLDAVITMNPDTFHGVGTHTVIALFTAGVPHPEHKQTAFVNFKNDGYKVRQHVGLVGEGNEDSHRQTLLSVLNDGVPMDTSFVVRSRVTAKDEWLHSYFYFNDQPPSYDDFLKTFADYLTWETDMQTHGYGHLIVPLEDVVGDC
ncbi:HsdM family class I SAM-dependent methyltransferase [Corynebacterium macclintockiae]|uniref:HsdM family class I SAM-dependent methyltransferase n=1 Tax=Corynebacterium macclintockiae TaxID=2913501 RepID=UPI003EBDFEF5